MAIIFSYFQFLIFEASVIFLPVLHFKVIRYVVLVQIGSFKFVNVPLRLYISNNANKGVKLRKNITLNPPEKQNKSFWKQPDQNKRYKVLRYIKRASSTLLNTHGITKKWFYRSFLQGKAFFNVTEVIAIALQLIQKQNISVAFFSDKFTELF